MLGMQLEKPIERLNPTQVVFFDFDDTLILDGPRNRTYIGLSVQRWRDLFMIIQKNIPGTVFGIITIRSRCYKSDHNQSDVYNGLPDYPADHVRYDEIERKVFGYDSTNEDIRQFFHPNLIYYTAGKSKADAMDHARLNHLVDHFPKTKMILVDDKSYNLSDVENAGYRGIKTPRDAYNHIWHECFPRTKVDWEKAGAKFMIRILKKLEIPVTTEIKKQLFRIYYPERSSVSCLYSFFRSCCTSKGLEGEYVALDELQEQEISSSRQEPAAGSVCAPR